MAIAKQALSELNMSANYEYEPIWTENKKQYTLEFLKKILASKVMAEKQLEEFTKRNRRDQQGN